MSTTRIQLRGDTAANWTSANPVLADREIGLETDTKKIKVGNGSLSWNSLDYFLENTAALNYYTTGATLDGTTLNFDRNDLADAYSVDLSSLGGTDYYTTGVTLDGTTLNFDRNDLTDAYSVNLSSLAVDNYTTGATLAGTTLVFNRTDSLSAYTVSLSSLAGGTPVWTAGTGSSSIKSVDGANTSSSTGSLAGGISSTASGTYAFAYGNTAAASANYAFAHGQFQTQSGTYGASFGYGHITSNSYSLSFGQTTRNYGSHSLSAGGTHFISGNYAYCFGRGTRTGAGTNYNFMGGHSTTENFNSSGSYNFGWQYHTSASQDGFDSSYGTILAGAQNKISTSSDYSGIIVGSGCTVTSAARAVIIGLQGYTATQADTTYVGNLAVTESFTPSGSGDTAGVVGQISWDDTYMYVKTNTGWGRISLDYGF